MAMTHEFGLMPDINFLQPVPLCILNLRMRWDGVLSLARS